MFQCFEFRSLGPKVFSDQGFFGVQYSSKTGSPQSPQCLDEHHKLLKARYGTIQWSVAEPAVFVTRVAGMMQTPRRDRGHFTQWLQSWGFVCWESEKPQWIFPSYSIRLYQILYTVHYCTTFFCIRTCRCCLFLWKLCEMWWFPLEVVCYLWWGTPFIITLDGCEILHQSVDAWFSSGKPIDYLQCFILTNSYPLVI